MIPKLAGRRVIVLEPNLFMAGYIGAALTNSGADVLGETRSVEQCVAWLDTLTIHAAVLSLDNRACDPAMFAALFRQRGVPIGFLSGTRHAAPPDMPEAPHLQKPFAAYQVVHMVVALTAR